MMQLSKKVAAALVEQINSEWNAAYIYLAMSSYFDDQDLPGFALWFRNHAREETTHALRLYEFVVARDCRVELSGIDKPPSEFDGPCDVIKAALAHERKVSAQINNLFDLAQSEKEFATQTMLNWFITEQVEEEDTFRDLLKRTKAAEEFRWSLLAFDKELGAEAAAAPVPLGISAPADGASQGA